MLVQYVGSVSSRMLGAKFLYHDHSAFHYKTMRKKHQVCRTGYGQYLRSPMTIRRFIDDCRVSPGPMHAVHTQGTQAPQSKHQETVSDCRAQTIPFYFHDYLQSTLPFCGFFTGTGNSIIRDSTGQNSGISQLIQQLPR